MPRTSLTFLALVTVIALASCTFETNTAQGTRRGVLQGIIRDGTLGIIEEAQPSSQEGTQSQEGQPAGDEAATTTGGTPSPPAPSASLPNAGPRHPGGGTPSPSVGRGDFLRNNHPAHARVASRSTFGRGLAGVQVTAFVDGSYKTTTTVADDPKTAQDEAGTFALKDLPSGVDIPIYLFLQDYAPVRATFTLPAAINAGGSVILEDPQLSVEIDLVKTTGQLTVNVFANQGPAVGATAVLDLTSGPLVNTSGGNLSGGFDVFRQGTTNDQGQLIFDGLPATVIPAGALVILPFDSNGDAIPDFTTFTNQNAVDLSLLTAGTGVSTINVDLTSANTVTPTIVWSNIANARPFNKTGNVIVIFSRPLDPSRFQAVLTANSLNVAFEATWEAGNVKVTINPLKDLEPSQSYSFTINSAFDALGQPLGGFGPITFPVIEGASALASPKVALWENPDLSGTRNESDINYDTREVDLQWDAVAGAISYIVYAKDSKDNTDWVETARKGPTPGTQFLNMDPTNRLPVEFDAGFTGDGLVTPFAFGVQVGFAVVPINRDGIPGVIDKEKTLAVADKNPPELSTTTLPSQALVTGQVNIQDDTTASNLAGTADKLLAVRLTFSEFMDTGAKPTVSIIEEGANADCPTLSTLNGGNNSGKPTLNGEFTWDSSPLAGVIQIVIPKAQDAREDCVKFDFSSVKDSSGNAPVVTTKTTVYRLQ